MTSFTNGTVDMSATLSGFEHDGVPQEDRRDWFGGANPSKMERICDMPGFEPLMPENEEPEDIHKAEKEFIESESCFGRNFDYRPEIIEPEIPANVDCDKLTRERCQVLIKHFANELHCMCLWGAKGGHHGPNDYEYRQCPCECVAWNSSRNETLGFPGVYDNIEGEWLVPDCPLNTPDSCDCATTFGWQQLADNPYVPTNILRYVATSLCQHLNHNEGLRRDKEARAND